MGRVYNKKFGYSEAVTLVGEDGKTLGDRDTPIIVQGSPTASPVIVQNVGTSITNKTILDTYGRQRISEPQTLFEGSFSEPPMTVNPYWDTFSSLLLPLITQGVVHNPLESTVSLNTSTIGEVAEVTSHRYLSSGSGSSHIVYMTGVLDHKSLTATSRIGIFDANDGVAFSMDALGGINIIIRSSITGLPVETVIPRVAWTDKLDGNGLSGITVDFTTAQTFVVDYAPTGVGLVRFGVMQGGEFYTCLVLDGANRGVSPLLRSTSLPITFQLISTVAGIASIKAFGATCIVEGEGRVTNSLQQSALNPVPVAPVVGVPTPVISISLKPIFPLLTGSFNRTVVSAVDINTYDGSGSYFWSLWRNATLTAPLWVSAGVRSACMVDTAALGILPLTGTRLISGMSAKRTDISKIVLDSVQELSVNRYTNISDTLTLCIEDDPNGKGSTPIGSITWREER